MAPRRPRKIDPDFIDRYEVAKLLDLAHPESYSGYETRYATTVPFPAPVHRIANSAIRRASQVKVWRLTVEGKRIPPTLARQAEQDLTWPAWALDREQVAQALGVAKPATVSRYASDPDQGFPRPLRRYAGHPVWHLEDVEAWEAARPGHGGASRGPRAKGTCPGCGTPRVIRRDGTVVVHAVAPSRGGGVCRGSGQKPVADAA